VLTEFGPQPEPGPWKEFAQNVFFAGGGFSPDSPGSLLDVLGHDATGAVLDMLVTHLFQVAAEVAMEPPASLGSLDLQDAREKVIRSFRPLETAEVVLGQFDGYRDVPGVAPRSSRDTFVAARLWIDNPRWRGVPFYLRTGKRLAASQQRSA